MHASPCEATKVDVLDFAAYDLGVAADESFPAGIGVAIASKITVIDSGPSNAAACKASACATIGTAASRAAAIRTVFVRAWFTSPSSFRFANALYRAPHQTSDLLTAHIRRGSVISGLVKAAASPRFDGLSHERCRRLRQLATLAPRKGPSARYSPKSYFSGGGLPS